MSNTYNEILGYFFVSLLLNRDNKSNMKKFMTKSTVEEKVDANTGEITTVETRKEFRVPVKSEHFFITFLEALGSLYGIKNLSDMKVMMCMCELAEYDSGVVHLTKGVRLVIQEKTGVSITNLSKNLNRLKSLDLLVEKDGDYTLNPAVFWKGSLKARSEQMKVDGIQFNITFYDPTPTINNTEK